ncbi:hypothetical protein [Algoriphagus sp.]|uniref:hypothetical protein n=1 Tax=Algoriphagus sp. TaxID=1872435 RepID=UPI0025E6FAE5|nr:hypothetical protein [Algoriphagus sp.]
MKKRFIQSLIFFSFSVFWTNSSFAQDSLPYTDSTSFYNFLELQEEIPSFKFRYKITSENPSPELLNDSSLLFVIDEQGVYLSKAFEKYSTWYQAGENYLLKDESIIEPDFLIYDSPSDYNAARDYVDNLWRNKDIFITEKKPEVGDVLVILANLVPYEPLVKYRFHFFSDFKLILVTSIIGFFLIMAIGMILYMIFIKGRAAKVEAKEKIFESQIVGPLSILLFEKTEEEINSLSETEIFEFFPEKDFKKLHFKHVLINKIISLNKKMKGDFKDKLKALYKKLKLDEISIKKLNSKRWDIVTTGLVQINEMDLVEALPQVQTLTDSSNFYIRSQSIATLLNLSEKVDLTTIKKQSFPLSRWQQMNYLRIIKFLHIQKSIQLETLFEGKNQTIRLFGYKLVGLLGRVDLLEKLAKLAPQVADIEKIEILKTYQTIGVHTESTFINKCLRSDNIKLVVAAAKASGQVGDQVSAHILIELLNDDPGFELKMIYLDNLRKLDQSMYQQYVATKNDKELNQINAHLLDPLLQHV